MIKRRSMLALAIPGGPASAATRDPEITNVRFGVVRQVSEGIFEFVEETTLIQRRLKSTGYRFGVGFDNPKCEMIEWYEQIHLPKPLKEVTGNFQQARTSVMRSITFKSDRPTVVDEFWFDEGDPLGRHRLELSINGKLRHWFGFVVVP
jgi:hypothetical protein